MDTALTTLRRRAAGVVFLLVPVLLVWLSIAVYDKQFSRADLVGLDTGSVGNEMNPHADVKLDGVVVGEVRGISADGAGAHLQLAINPRLIGRIPADVTAQMLPTTLFGERYVALIPGHDPAGPAGSLHSGMTISQDRSRDGLELQKVLDDVLPLLTDIRPQDLSATLTAVSQALRGRGAELGRTIVRLDGYLKRFNPDLPRLNSDIEQLVGVASTYGQASPDLLNALTDFVTTSRTVVQEQTNFSALYSGLAGSAQDLRGFVADNRQNIIRLAASGKPTLRQLARYSPEFPCLLDTMANFVPVMDKVLGKGTGRPGLHVNVDVVPSRGRYLPGVDTPRYTKSGGPHCYSVPYTGGAAKAGPAGATGAAGANRAAGTAAANPTVPAGGAALGPADSPQENELVNELIAPSLRTGPGSLPGWSSLLVGPVFRGTKVVLK